MELYWVAHKMIINVQNQAWEIVSDQEIQDMAKILPRVADIIPVWILKFANHKCSLNILRF